MTIDKEGYIFCDECGTPCGQPGDERGVCKVCGTKWEVFYDEEDNSCPDCQGTGIGYSGPPDRSKCHTCGGRGYFEKRGRNDD
jgi:hypothetical protein